MCLLTEYDLRQLMLINKKLSCFGKRKLNLFEIVCDLSGFLNALEAVSESWKDDFRAEVNALEVIHNCIEDGSISQWKGDYKEDMYIAISKLKKMTLAILETYLEQSDLNISDSAIEGDPNWLICPKCNDAWQSHSMKAMVICPKCDRALHNPRIRKRLI